MEVLRQMRESPRDDPATSRCLSQDLRSSGSVCNTGISVDFFDHSLRKAMSSHIAVKVHIRVRCLCRVPWDAVGMFFNTQP